MVFNQEDNVLQFCDSNRAHCIYIFTLLLLLLLLLLLIIIIKKIKLVVLVN